MGFLSFSTLIWKNFMLQVRHPWITSIEILIPIITMVMLILSRGLSDIESKAIETVFDTYDIDDLPEEYLSDFIYLYYTPKSSFTDEIMKNVSPKLNVSVQGFDTEEELVNSYHDTHSRVIAGVVFPESYKDGFQSDSFTFTIRPESIAGVSWNLSSYIVAFPRFYITDKSLYGSLYGSYGFLSIQHAIIKTFMDERFFQNDTEKFDDRFTIKMRRHPYPPYHSDSFYHLPEYYLLIGMCISLIFSSLMIAKNLVREKETNFKSALMIMGIANWENWTAWFIKDFIFLGVITIIMTALSCIKFGGAAVLDASDSALIFLWLILYACSLIAFTYFISTFFYSQNAAVAAACILFIITFLPYIHARGELIIVPLNARLISCLLPNTLFAFSVRIVLRLELQEKGLQWSTLDDTKALNEKMSMRLVFIMFIADVFIYFILTWYVEVMRPGKFQRHYPWYFPLMAKYWTGAKDIPRFLARRKESFGGSHYFERDPPRVKPMIDIRNVTKKYDKNAKPVLDNIHLKAYKGQITVLLGENGCGKSTLASMIYGGVLPTGGTILIKNYNMCKSDDTRKIRSFLGVYPEYDVSINELDCKENLYFFGRIKGHDTRLKSEIDNILSMLDLEIRKKMLVSYLSQISRQMLSIGIALIAQSEVLILDEPTLNMDNESRRLVWDCLRMQKHSRAIFITTSHLKEAVALGDKIAVLYEGRIKCCGSPTFLKQEFDAGYLLTISKQPECNSAYIKNLIFNRIPDAIINSDAEDELKVSLPIRSTSLYPVLLKELEEKNLKIIKINLTQISLAELHHRFYEKSIKLSDKEHVKENSKFCYLVRERNEGYNLFKQHILALLTKKFLFSKHNIILTLIRIIFLPILIIFVNLLSTSHIRKSEVLERSFYDKISYEKSTVAYGIDPSSNTTIDLGDTYASLLEKENLDLVDLNEENYLYHLIRTATEDLKLYSTHYIIGAVFSKEINKSSITAYYNSDAFHSAPTSLLYVHNAISVISNKNKSLYFDVKTKPLPFKSRFHTMESTTVNLQDSFFWTFDLSLGLAILMGSFTVLPVVEKSSKAKKQQFICGLDAFVYWFSSFIYDFVLYIVPCIITIAILAIFDTPCLSGSAEFSSLFVLLLFHGVSSLLFLYCTTFFHHSSSTAYIGTVLDYCLGLTILFIIYSLDNYGVNNISEPINALATIFMPSYCVSRAIYNIHRNCVSNLRCNNPVLQEECQNNTASATFLPCCLETCRDSCIAWSPNYFSVKTPGIGYQIIALVIQPFFFCLFLVLFEMELCKHLKMLIREKQMRYYKDSLSSNSKIVQEEADKILYTPLNQLTDESYYLILRNVSKLLPKFAVGKLSFGIKKGECFALVGIENTGKSAILKMMNGKTLLSTGNVYVDGDNILKYPLKIQDKIGFSFGIKTLNKDLTVKETLTFYARIRGIPEEEIQHFIQSLTDILSLNFNERIEVSKYTTKKKLCTAITLLGTPPLILLDEPTDEMDLVTREKVKEAIKQALAVGCTVFLTTRRVKEYEALCNRIGIVQKGKLIYIGDFERLKAQYADGLTLLLRSFKSSHARTRFTRQALNIKGNLEEIKGIIEDKFPQATAKIEYPNFLNYFIPKQEMIWSELFNLLENLKYRELISDYSVFDTNLEQIYNYHFALSEEKEGIEIAAYLKERLRNLT